MPSFLSPALKSRATRHVLVIERTGEVLVSALELAVESETRRRGLLGRGGLVEGAGLVIAPTNAVHTFFMRFPIDIMFLTRSGDVVKIKPGVGPRRMAAAFRGFAVLEMAANSAARAGLVVGDRLIVRPVES